MRLLALGHPIFLPGGSVRATRPASSSTGALGVLHGGYPSHRVGAAPQSDQDAAGNDREKTLENFALIRSMTPLV